MKSADVCEGESGRAATGEARLSVGEILRDETAGGAALLVATVAALLWANLAGGSYEDFWHHELTLGIGRFSMTESLHAWATDGLMTLFFFVVGLELKREIVDGELRDPRSACLPLMAALGGMLAPAAIFAALNAGGAGAKGWGTPMATDIAFAVAVVAVLGSRVPKPLKLFLLTLAVADDLGSIAVIAIFYSHGFSLAWFAAAGATVGAMLLMRRVGISSPWLYVVPAFVLWVCFSESGIHATLAGVVLGFLVPVRPVRGVQVNERLEHYLLPWSTMVVVPIFAVASAGVALDTDALRGAATNAVGWGVFLGLVVGKPVGILVASTLALRLGIARMPRGVTLRHVLGAGAVAGMGFTVALFVAQLSFDGTLLEDAKIAILLASLTSALLGSAILLRAGVVGRSNSPPALAQV